LLSDSAPFFNPQVVVCAAVGVQYDPLVAEEIEKVCQELPRLWKGVVLHPGIVVADWWLDRLAHEFVGVSDFRATTKQRT
jgi:hypothetical protein